MTGDLGHGGGLARALQADDRHHGGVSLEVERPVASGEQPGQLVVDDGDDLLAGRQALEHLGAHGALPDAGDEVLDDLEVDVRFEQSQADLAHRRVDIRLTDPAAAGEGGEGLAEALTESVEHARTRGSRRSVGDDGRASRRLVREFWRHRSPASVAHARSRAGSGLSLTAHRCALHSGAQWQRR